MSECLDITTNEKQNNDSLFNIMDLLVDIVINDRFLANLESTTNSSAQVSKYFCTTQSEMADKMLDNDRNEIIVDNNLEENPDSHTTIMTLEQEPRKLAHGKF